MDKTNSQTKSSNASVGSDQPIEVPEISLPLNTKEPKPSGEQNQRRPPERSSGRQQSHAHEDSHRPTRRYYDDSDDMIERVRRTRAAFEKRINAFQGPDWPYYTKRVIVGKKKKGNSTPTENGGTSENSQSENDDASQPVAPDKSKE